MSSKESLENERGLTLGKFIGRLEFYSELGAEFLFSSVREVPLHKPELKDSRTRLHELHAKIRRCQRCPLGQTRQNAVPGEGDFAARVMFVGEGPGRDEDDQGRPFVGRAGQLLTRIIEAMKLKRKDVYITNVVKCRPPRNREPQAEEIKMCRDYLLEQINIIEPEVIVTLGRVAASFFIRSHLGMTALRGNYHEFNRVKVMPTFHPSYLIRNEDNKQLKKMVWEDMKKVMALLGI